MPRIHSHPAFRIPPERPIRDESDDFIEATRLLADTPTTYETPGVAPDDLTDQLIGMARKWVEREDRSRRMSSELDR